MVLVFIWFKRLLAAASEPVLPLLTVFVAVIGLIVNQATEDSHLPTDVLYWVLAVGGVVWLAQTWFGFVRKTHDPSLALQYQKTWDGEEAHQLRAVAARTIEAYKSELQNVKVYEVELSDIDDAIDILEDIGFYVFGGQISPEAAHHHFYYWIQGYWCATQPYIRAVRKEKDPTRWDHIERLFDVTSTVETVTSGFKLSRNDLWLSDADLKKFLDEEKALNVERKRRDHDAQ